MHLAIKLNFRCSFSASEKTPESPRLPRRCVRVSPQSGAAAYHRRTDSPSRPSTLPVQSPVTSPPGAADPGGSQPIPVPSQVKAYEKIQRSIGEVSPSSPGAGATKGLQLESPKVLIVTGNSMLY